MCRSTAASCRHLQPAARACSERLRRRRRSHQVDEDHAGGCRNIPHTGRSARTAARRGSEGCPAMEIDGRGDQAAGGKGENGERRGGQPVGRCAHQHCACQQGAGNRQQTGRVDLVGAREPCGSADHDRGDHEQQGPARAIVLLSAVDARRCASPGRARLGPPVAELAPSMETFFGRQAAILTAGPPTARSGDSGSGRKLPVHPLTNTSAAAIFAQSEVGAPHLGLPTPDLSPTWRQEPDWSTGSKRSFGPVPLRLLSRPHVVGVQHGHPDGGERICCLVGGAARDQGQLVVTAL